MSKREWERERERADPVGQEDERAEEHGWVEGEVASHSQSQSRENLQTYSRCRDIDIVSSWQTSELEVECQGDGESGERESRVPSTGEDGKWLQEIAGEKAGVVTQLYHTCERERLTQ